MRKPIMNLNAQCADGGVIVSWFKSTPHTESGETEEFSRQRILRKVESFVFNDDYAEFFMGTDPEGADCLFDGYLEAQLGRKYVFRDTTASIGQTYAYWIATKSAPPVGPVPVTFRHPDVWWTHARIMAELEALQVRWPERVRIGTAGHSVRGARIPKIEVGSGEASLALIGAVHGGESGPELILPLLRRILEDAPELVEHQRIVALPVLNVDSREDEARGTPWYIRTNANGVDLNRNFPAGWDCVETGYGYASSDPQAATYRGPESASEPETRAAMAALSGEPFRAVFSMHALASICGLPALTAKTGASCDAYMQRCRLLIDTFGQAFYPEPEFAGQWFHAACTSGSLSRWIYETSQTPSFDLEGGIDVRAWNMCRPARTDPALLKEYGGRHYRGIRALLERFLREGKSR